LALGIYGLVLFPSAEGMIDFEAVNVFKNMVTLKLTLLQQYWQKLSHP
jgi:hypothetical protein